MEQTKRISQGVLGVAVSKTKRDQFEVYVGGKQRHENRENIVDLEDCQCVMKNETKLNSLTPGSVSIINLTIVLVAAVFESI